MRPDDELFPHLADANLGGPHLGGRTVKRTASASAQHAKGCARDKHTRGGERT
jgi:hypothetical protein